MYQKLYAYSSLSLLAVLFFLVSSFSLLAQAKLNMNHRYQINKDGSYIQFKTTLAGFPVIRGAVKAYQATIFYDPANVRNSSATIRIGTEGFSTAHDKRDAVLQGEEFLNASQFPAIWFQGTEVTEKEDGFDLSGTLNIKNISKPARLQIETPTLMPGAMNKQDLLFVKGKMKINRKDFELGTEGQWATNPMLGEEIEIEFSFMCFSYTIAYLQANFVREIEGRAHAVGRVYKEVKQNGVESGLKLVNSLMKDERYQKDNWLSNLANIGWILMVDGYGKESLPFYELALQKKPDHLSSLLRLGDAYVIAGEAEKALAHFKKERALAARAKFTHIPHMIKLLSQEFDLKDMQ
ncbi:MAG: YceI family protein [Saprospiraceae bacterium]|nr:YceI family protein [Saprospiraceae bacterium]